MWLRFWFVRFPLFCDSSPGQPPPTDSVWLPPPPQAAAHPGAVYPGTDRGLPSPKVADSEEPCQMPVGAADRALSHLPPSKSLCCFLMGRWGKKGSGKGWGLTITSSCPSSAWPERIRIHPAEEEVKTQRDWMRGSWNPGSSIFLVPTGIAAGQFQGHWSLCGSDALLPSPRLLLGVKVRIGGTRNQNSHSEEPPIQEARGQWTK